MWKLGQNMIKLIIRMNMFFHCLDLVQILTLARSKVAHFALRKPWHGLLFIQEKHHYVQPVGFVSIDLFTQFLITDHV